MDRRDFVVLAGAALASPRALFATRALGIAIAGSVRLRVDEVIE